MTADTHFDGETYVHPRDGDRLARQLSAVYACLKDGEWRTLQQIADVVSAPPASVSARLRDFRKERFGQHTVNRRYVGEGLFEYQLIPHVSPPEPQQQTLDSTP